MKPKASSAPRGRVSRGKIVKKEMPSDDVINITGYSVQSTAKPAVEIVQCISFQKFRYSGENRPGKKYQEKEFMTLKLSHLQDKVVRVVIICTDADNRELIHPNGLVGKDCHDGIYDKEYAITKQFFLIKIPYLRTERMKTKKNEHSKILGVLSARACHLPSPYKERCLSQCTDKYTSSREKFDTTKVCLGVIVTVESHQGVLNGSLHAISHVVRNASEKTTLSILKLSSETVPALTGACIDIFTTEDGPAIEPDKYQVFVSYGSEGSPGHWVSEKASPGKTELLYKRVIVYQIPPFEPNPTMVSPVEATLHLQCPQSNQYCSINFHYVPGDMVIVDDQTYSTQKPSFMEQDVKPRTKSLRTEAFDSDGGRDTIKANLKTKIKARNEIPSSVGTMYMDSAEEEESVQYTTDPRQQHQVYVTQDCPVIIHHRDPQTGETSYLLDMDASKNSSGTATFVDGENQYVIQFPEKGSPILQTVKNMREGSSIVNAQSQDFKVVATGYSDDVPANAVLVYTTNGALPQRADDNEVKHVPSQRVSTDGQIIMAQSSGVIRHGEKPAMTTTASSVSSKSNAKIMQTDYAAEKRVQSEVTDVEMEDESTDNRLTSAQIASSSNGNGLSVSSSAVSERFGQSSTASSLAIPPIRRMLIPNKAMSSASPWEVCNGDDSDPDYNLVLKAFESASKRPSSHSIEFKNEPVDEDPLRGRSVIYAPSTSQQRVTKYYIPTIPIPERQLHHLEGSTHSKSQDSQKSATEEPPATSGDESVHTGLTSIEVAAAIADNLPTFKIYEIAEGLENSQ